MVTTNGSTLQEEWRTNLSTHVNDAPDQNTAQRGATSKYILAASLHDMMWSFGGASLAAGLLSLLYGAYSVIACTGQPFAFLTCNCLLVFFPPAVKVNLLSRAALVRRSRQPEVDATGVRVSP